MKRLVGGVFLIAGFATAPLTGQQTVTERLTGHVPQAIIPVVEGLADSAVARGLPVAPIVNKALEGAVKGVPADRIVIAVRTVFAQLDRSADALRGAGVTTPEAIEAGAFAIAAGLDSNDIATVARSADRGHPATTALQVLATLTAMGVPRGQGVGLVQATIRSGQPVADLESLPSRVQARVSHGIPPAQAAAGLERAANAHAAPKPHGQGKEHGNPHQP